MQADRKSLLFEAWKLLRVTHYLLVRYLTLPSHAKSRTTRKLFTYLYRQAVDDRPGEVREATLVDLYPSRPVAEIRICNNVDFLTSAFVPTRLPLQSAEELNALACLVSFEKPRRLFQFGTHNGISAYNLFINAPADAEVYTLDIDPRPLTDENVLRMSATGRFHRIVGDSNQIDLSAHFGKLDFVLVDGGHEYRTVKRDTENALAMLGANGLVVWHDYSRHCPGVFRYLNALHRELPLVHLAGTKLVLYRKGAPHNRA